MHLRVLFSVLCLTGLLANSATLKGDEPQTFSGIGVKIKSDARKSSDPLIDHAIVLSVLPDSPAGKAGIEEDDKIIQINDLNLTGKHLSDIDKMLRGDAGATVKVIIIREGSPGALTFTLTRAVLPLF